MRDILLLPPNCPQEVIDRCHPQDRDDAIQEAWVAHLEGKDPVKAVRRFRKSEDLIRQRMVTNHNFNAEVDE